MNSWREVIKNGKIIDVSTVRIDNVFNDHVILRVTLFVVTTPNRNKLWWSLRIYTETLDVDIRTEDKIEDLKLLDVP